VRRRRRSLRPVVLDPAKTALLLMDFLRDVLYSPARGPRAAAALPALQTFLGLARARGVLIVQTAPSKGEAGPADLALRVAPIAGEKLYRAHFDKFHGNDLDLFCATLEFDSVNRDRHLGPMAACIRKTTMGAVLRGFSRHRPGRRHAGGDAISGAVRRPGRSPTGRACARARC